MVDSWVWKPNPNKGFLVGSTYGSLMALAGPREDRSKRVVKGLFRVWKS